MLDTRGVKITWLGHATFVFRTPSGKTILVDPWVTGNPACPEKSKKLDRIDTMFITHGHFDHIADAVSLAREHKPGVVAVYETCAWLESKGVANTLPMNKGGTQRVGEIEVTMVHADHSCGILDDGKIVYGGESVGYVIRFENGLKVYHAGDTNVFGDMRIIRELYSPDIAMLPIGDLFTMSPREAALACRLLGTKRVIPMHYGTFPPLTGTPAALRELTRDIPGFEVVDFQPGQTMG